MRQAEEASAPEFGAFTTDQVLRLTGVSRRRLAYWLDQGIVGADVDEARGRGHVRLFSFRNLIEIRVAVWLRDKLSLQLIRKVVRRLREDRQLEHPLAQVTIGIVEDERQGRSPPKQRVVIAGPDGEWADWKTDQLVLSITLPIERFASELRVAAERDLSARRRPGQIERRRGVLGHTDVLAGTRVPTKAIWSLHVAGYDTERILRNYPGLTAADVAAAVSEERRRRAGTA